MQPISKPGIVVISFTVGLLLGGLFVASIASYAMHPRVTKVVDECHDKVMFVTDATKQVECPAHASIELQWDESSQGAWIVCRCASRPDQTLPQDIDGFNDEPYHPAPPTSSQKNLLDL